MCVSGTYVNRKSLVTKCQHILRENVLALSKCRSIVNLIIEIKNEELLRGRGPKEIRHKNLHNMEESTCSKMFVVEFMGADIAEGGGN